MSSFPTEVMSLHPAFVEGRNFVLHGFGPNPLLLFHQLRRKEGLQVARYLGKTGKIPIAIP